MTDWGNVPEWLAAIGTSGALIFTGITVRRQTSDRRRRQAALVSAWWRRLDGVSDGYMLEYHNASDEPVWNLTVWATPVEKNAKGELSFGDRRPFIHGDMVRPGAGDRVTIGGVKPAPPFTPNVEIEFSDAAGRRWHRDARGRLTTPGPLERRRRRRAAGTMGC